MSIAYRFRIVNRRSKLLLQSHDVILFLPFAQYEQLSVDRLIARQPHLWIGRAPIVDVHTAGLHEPARFAL